jgi:hypothetical protein
MPFLGKRRALRLVCPLAVACLLTGTAGAQTFKLADWNIKSRKGQIAFPGHPVTFVDTIAAEALLGPPVITVSISDDLQTVLDSVAPGTIVQLPAGAVYGLITIRRSVTLQGQGVRFVAPTNQNALVIESGDVTLVGVELTGNANDLLLIKPGAGYTTIRHAYIHGDPVNGAKRGIQANGRGITLEDSTITDIFRVGQESSGIGAWNTPGPFTIRRNRIQAAGVNFLFGGADPSSSANTPADILIEDNEFSKKLEWRGLGYAAKNLGEFKNARRVIVRNNLFRYSWVEGQTAYGLVLAVRNQSGSAPYSTVEDVLIEGNTIRDVGTAVSILGRDTNYPSQTMRNVTFRNNIFDNINKAVYGGRGTAFEILNGPERLTIEGTQVVNTPLAGVHSALFFGYGANPTTGLVVRGNRFIEGTYGIIGDGTLTVPTPTSGVNTLNAYAPGTIWENNTVVRLGSTIVWPVGTLFDMGGLSAPRSVKIIP